MMWGMFRTRDFVLLFVTIVFLAVAITATVATQPSDPVVTAGPQLSESSISEYQAEVHAPETLSRAERLAAMRQKIADGGGVTLRAPEAEVAATPATDTDVTAAAAVAAVGELQHCAGYAAYTGPWPRQGVTLAVVEGARLVFEDSQPDGTMTSTTTPATPSRSVLLQLPAAPVLATTPHCVASDVIGVAQDGSLIRNHEAALYGVFGPETLVGYALDGLPIYGTNDAVVHDACGGALVAGQYGYYLSSNRLEVLHCFSAAPATL